MKADMIIFMSQTRRKYLPQTVILLELYSLQTVKTFSYHAVTYWASLAGWS